MLTGRLKLDALVTFLLVLVVSGGLIYAQRKDPSEKPLFDATPSVALPQVTALGPRVRKPGKEQTIFDGQFVDATGNRAVRVIYQLPGLVRLEGFKNGQGMVTFDGKNVHGQVARVDETVIETFVLDMAEGMLSTIQAGGAAVRLLGRNFGPDPRKVRNYTGPRYDIFDVTASVRIRADQVVRTKRYYFDSKTGLLLMTKYSDRSVSPVANVVTHFSDWVSQDGSAYPGRIERFENGKPAFSFIIRAVTAGPGQDSANFR